MRPEIISVSMLSAISIHAPLAGCDAYASNAATGYQFQSTHPSRGATTRCSHCFMSLIFQSTHPSRGATSQKDAMEKILSISIHAPLAGCDLGHGTPTPTLYYFNPRTPRGVRLVTKHCNIVYQDFNPRTPRGVRQPNFKIPTCSNTLIVSDNQYFYLFSYLLKRFIDIRRIFQVRTSLYFLNSLYFAP